MRLAPSPSRGVLLHVAHGNLRLQQSGLADRKRPFLEASRHRDGRMRTFFSLRTDDWCPRGSVQRGRSGIEVNAGLRKSAEHLFHGENPLNAWRNGFAEKSEPSTTACRAGARWVGIVLIVFQHSRPRSFRQNVSQEYLSSTTDVFSKGVCPGLPRLRSHRCSWCRRHRGCETENTFRVGQGTNFIVLGPAFTLNQSDQLASISHKARFHG